MTTARNGDVALAYEESGTGEPLLMIMGLSGSRQAWGRLVPHLDDRVRCLRFDNRGTGDSDPARGLLSMGDMVADTLAVLDAAGHASAHVIGVSMGGMIAQHLALEHRRRVRSLILGCTTPVGRNGAPPWRLLAATALRPVVGATRTFELVAPALYAERTRREQPERIQADLQIRLQDATSVRTSIAQLGAIARHDTRRRLAELAGLGGHRPARGAGRARARRGGRGAGERDPRGADGRAAGMRAHADDRRRGRDCGSGDRAPRAGGSHPRGRLTRRRRATGSATSSPASCSMLSMPRPHHMIPALAAVLGTLALAPAVNAQVIEVGPTGDQAVGTPSCPTNCIAVTRTTGYQQSVGGTLGVFRVPHDGRLVAWSITLGSPGKKQVKFFDGNYGGEAQAGIAVLTTGKKARARLLSQSPVMKLTPYFGQTVQFPLEQTLAVSKDDLIALTVPTWAPALAVGLPGDAAWRASRQSACKAQSTTQEQTAQTTIGELKQYLCKYTTARLTYSATVVTNPAPPDEDDGKKGKNRRRGGR